MVRKIFLSVVLLSLFMAISLSFYFRNIRAQDAASPAETESKIVAKLDKIMDGQRKIVQQLEDLKKELRARCTP